MVSSFWRGEVVHWFYSCFVSHEGLRVAVSCVEVVICMYSVLVWNI